MLFPVELQQWLKTACGQIRDARKRQEVYDELLGHIWDKRDALMAQGVEERAAIQKVLEEMGSAYQLGVQMGNVYAETSREGMRKAVSLFAAGLVLQSIWADFWYLRPILMGAGMLLTLFALWKTKNSCDAMRAAWNSYRIYLLVQTALYLFCVLVKNPDLDVLSPILYFVGMLTVFCCFASGLHGLSGEEASVDGAILCYGLATLGVTLSAWLMWGILPIILIALLGLITLILLHKASRYLYEKDVDVAIAAVGKRSWGQILPLAAAAVILPILAVHLCNTPSPAVYYQTLADQAQQQELVAKGMPQEVASMLLPEEAEMFLSSKRDFYVEDGDELADVLQTLANCPLDGGNVHFYTVSAQMENGLVRMLFAFEWENMPQHAYTDALCLSSNVKMYRVEHCLLAGDNRMERLDQDSIVLNGENNVESFCERVELRLLPNTRGYIAYTCYDSAKEPAFGLLTYLHRTDMMEFGRDRAMDLIHETIGTALGDGALRYGEEIGVMVGGSFSQLELQ